MGQSHSVFFRRVTVQSKSGYIKKDNIEQLFSDRSKSGGGPIEEIELRSDNKTALITYKYKYDAERVLTNDTISHKDTIYLISQPEYSAIQLSNIPTGMTQETIVLLLEKHHSSPLSSCPLIDIQTEEHKANIVFGRLEEALKMVALKTIAHKGISMPMKHVLLSSDNPIFKQKMTEETVASGEASNDISKQVVVFGPDDNCNEDMMRILFESKHRSGGGAIQYIHIDKDTNTALITFYYQSDADEVLNKWQIVFMDKIYRMRKPSHLGSKTQTAKQSTFDLSAHPDIKIDQSEAQVQFGKVAGMEGPSEEELRHELKFKRNMFGGCETTAVNIDRENHTALITYRSQSDARKAYIQLKKTGTTLSGTSLALSILEPLHHFPRSHAVEVVNLNSAASPDASKQMLTQYFGTLKTRFGGPITSIYLREDRKSAVICFTSHEDFKFNRNIFSAAARVSEKKSHWLTNRRVHVKKIRLQPSPHLFRGPVERNLVLLFWSSCTASSSVDSDTIRQFVADASAKVDLLQVVFAAVPGKALLVFKQEPDFRSLRCHCLRYPMLDLSVQVQRVPESRSIRVFDCSSMLFLRLYFESQKVSGGGEIEKLETLDGSAIITFKEKQTLDRILARKHKFENGQKMEISKYFPCIGVPAVRSNGAKINRPRDITVHIDNRPVFDFITHSCRGQEIELKLRCFDCKITEKGTQNADLILQCTLDENRDDFATASREWEEAVKTEITKIIAKLASTKITIASKFWAEFQVDFSQRLDKIDPNMLSVKFCESDLSCTIAGVKRNLDICQNELNQTLRKLMTRSEKHQ
ncbi:hypothetical protein CAPTEDRAFT_195184 [Capitella teleta]|uniref:RRM domain-containing protein n=1 Tax=Capitella teleta TaxID=283909 RepID=R7UD74_CAPTE|nr:hypothetical protein CAPTEDRAFT_195184 [Capitella teleta]|eukprot:ELU01753.1 hypothetical protein CAPTEDRAFT_195184 [Capitella teleta]